ncbi:hypothetical protein LIPSTDRAFT_75040 [Lipomyces starkeyi NRRL Y-11557]|uniref:Uncharacterized protein n=1 Tax=Lipomyces starkeyi NRRL Y-11557 TaxID=675824 RepID=A0A1E3PXI8_LIPST|nr:hypothetical protein LIPSTDRAFT_75040 [Lipomyces starkeyi NRRL Y-11557]
MSHVLISDSDPVALLSRKVSSSHYLTIFVCVLSCGYVAINAQGSMNYDAVSQLYGYLLADSASSQAMRASIHSPKSPSRGLL